MGSVVVVYRIMPSDIDSIQSVKKAVEHLKPARIEEEPIAFGMSAINRKT